MIWKKWKFVTVNNRVSHASNRQSTVKGKDEYPYEGPLGRWGARRVKRVVLHRARGFVATNQPKERSLEATLTKQQGWIVTSGC